ncbi:protein SFI1 homolog [Clytia hemisphaerica]
MKRITTNNISKKNIRKKTKQANSNTDKHNTETKEKVLLKKAFTQWKIVAFGSRVPSDSRKHYEQRLKEKYLKKWLGCLSEKKQFWKLEIRAEYHDRYRVWAGCLQRWKEFVVVQKEKKKLLELATKHANKVLLSKTLRCFQQFIGICHHKKRMHDKAMLFYEVNLQRHNWRQWIKRYERSCFDKHLMYISLKQWSLKMQHKIFDKWKSEYVERCNLNQRLLLCDVYNNTKSVKKTFSSWKSYIQYRRSKKKVQDIATTHYKETMKQNIFTYWRRRHKRALNIKESEQQIEDMAKTFTKRRIFVHWKHYVTLQQYHKSCAEEAHSKYKISLKKRLFLHWRLSASLVIKINEGINQADKFHSNTVQRNFFKVWMIELEKKEDLKNNSLFDIADTYYRNKVFAKCIYGFVLHTKERKNIKRKNTLALNHFNSRIIPRYFSSWKHFITVQKNFQNLQVTAQKFNREIVYAKYFYQWLKEYHQSLRNVDCVEIAENYHDHAVKKSFFINWRKQWIVKKSRNGMKARCINYKQQKYERKYFKFWKETWKCKIIHEKIHSVAEQHCNKRLTKKCMNGFIMYHQVCQNRRSKEEKACNHAQTRLNSKVFIAWKGYVSLKKSQYFVAEQMYQEKYSVLLRYSIFQWKEFVLQQKHEKHLLSHAQAFHLQWLKKKAFSSLKFYARQKIEQRFWDDEATIRTQIRIENASLKRCFIYWREQTSVQQEVNQKTQLAYQHHVKQLKKKALYGLKVNVLAHLRKKVLQGNCMVFYTSKLENKYFAIWYEKHRQMQEEYRKINIALFWWSLQLQKKVFAALKVNREHCLRKKLEYKQALLFRRQMLIEKGITRWIEYANNAIERRRRIAYNIQVQNCMALQSRVRCYAMHWLRVTQKSRSRNKDNMPPLRTTNETIAVHQTSRTDIKENSLGKIRKEERESERFIKYNIDFPIKRTRPSPRQPNYLRDSYDIKQLRNHATSNTLNQYPIEVDSQPRCGPITTEYSLQNHPRLPDISAGLELTGEEQDFLPENKNIVLLPPSNFS